MDERNKMFPDSEMSGGGFCKICIREPFVAWQDWRECGRKVTHETNSGTEICSYHARQKGFKKANPKPLR